MKGERDEKRKPGPKENKTVIRNKNMTTHKKKTTDYEGQERNSVDTTRKTKKVKANDFQYHFTTETIENKKKIENIQATRDRLCKYLDKKYANSTWLMENIKVLCDRTEKAPMKQEFIFENTRKAVKHNTMILKKYEYNFKKVIPGHKGTALSPGSEFRPTKALQKL